MTISKRVLLKAGQTLNIDGFLFQVEKNCFLKLHGEDISEYYPTDQRDKIMIAEYHLECPAIKIKPIFRYGYYTDFIKLRVQNKPEVYKPAFIVHTGTDIGGCYVYVDKTRVAFLSNSIGDGNYRLKFQNGHLYR